MDYGGSSVYAESLYMLSVCEAHTLKKVLMKVKLYIFREKIYAPFLMSLTNTQFYLNTMRGFWSIICSGDQRLLGYLKDSD